MRFSKLEIAILLFLVATGGYLVFQASRGASPIRQAMNYFNAKRGQSPSCKEGQAAKGYLEIDRETLKKIHLGAKSLKLSPPPGDCHRSGQRLEFVMRGWRDKEIFAHKSTVFVQSVDRTGELNLRVAFPHLGNDVSIAGQCFDFCDSTLAQLPAKSAPDRRIVEVQVGDFKSWTTKIEGALQVQIPIEGKSFDLKALEPIKDQNFLVLTDSANWSRRNALRFMRALKEGGAKNVQWIPGGTRTAVLGSPLYPRAIRDVRSILPTELETHLASGAKLIFSGHELPMKRASVPFQLIPGSLHIKAKNIYSGPTPNTGNDVEKRIADSLSEGVDLLPKDLNTPIVVYGLHYLDFHPHYFILNLKQKGFKSVLWMRDGFEGYLEARRLGLLNKQGAPGDANANDVQSTQENGDE